MRLVLVRHGESEWNIERRVQGQSGTGLSDRGRAQSRRTAEVLAGVYRDAVVVTSDLQRTVETAAPMAALLGRDPLIEVGLRERDFGRWTGLLASQIADRDPELWERWYRGEDVVGELGGEDTPTLVSRVVTTIARLVEAFEGRPIVCVTHGGPVWHGTQHLLGLEDRVLGGVANCSITELDIDGGRGRGSRLVAWNQVAHLPPELRMVAPVAGRGRAATEEDAPPVGT